MRFCDFQGSRIVDITQGKMADLTRNLFIAYHYLIGLGISKEIFISI